MWRRRPVPTVRVMVTRTLLATTAALLLAATPAVAAPSTIAYIDGGNLWFSSVDGSQKRQITTTGTADRPFQVPSQAPDGSTVAVHKEAFDGGKSERPVLYRYDASGKVTHGNVMPVSSSATAPVYPIGLDMDWQGRAVAYGYSYCGFACTSIYRGYWLTFSDNQGAYPTNPQGASDAFFPSFYGERVISSDSGGSLFIQPDVPEAPFTTGYQGWLSGPNNNLNFRRAEVAMTGRQVALEWYSRTSGDSTNGIYVGEHGGTIPGSISGVCKLPTVGASGNVTFSYDGTLVAWHDDEGVKVAGAPNLAAGTDDCALSAPVRVISASGKAPALGGADPAAWLGGGTPGGPGGPGAPGGQTGGQGTQGGGAGGNAGGTNGGAAGSSLGLQLAGSTTRAALRKGLPVSVRVPKAGRFDVVATLPKRVAGRLGLRGFDLRVLGASGTKAGATVVARGSGTAKAAGVAKATLKLTPKAKRRISRLRGVTLAVKVSQGAATAQGTIRVR